MNMNLKLREDELEKDFTKFIRELAQEAESIDRLDAANKFDPSILSDSEVGKSTVRPPRRGNDRLKDQPTAPTRRDGGSHGNK